MLGKGSISLGKGTGAPVCASTEHYTSIIISVHKHTLRTTLFIPIKFSSTLWAVDS